MWLKYGIDEGGNLVEIDDVFRGKTNLKCPYCDGWLTAKKGRIKEPHFAHTQETCRAVGDRNNHDAPTLPLYDKFGVRLTSQELEILKKLWDAENMPSPDVEPLAKKGMVFWNPYKRQENKYEFTHDGKIAIGRLELMPFCNVLHRSVSYKLKILQQAVSDAYQVNSSTLHERRIDLQLYRAQIKRVLSQKLYFLEVRADEQTFHKIGVTARPIEERVAEVIGDLRCHYQNVAIKVLGTWERGGSIEKYFKYRYQQFNYSIGTYTEYFKFDDIRSVLRDLRFLKSQALHQYEIDIISGRLSKIEERIEEELQHSSEQQRLVVRSQAIKTGMQRAALWGTRIGRPNGADSDEEFLAKLSSQKVVEALNEGLSLRQAAQKAGVAVNTVRKVKAALQGR